MKSPISPELPLIRLEQVDSTQRVAANFLRQRLPFGAILARDQTAGRGRFDRTWVSRPDDSLTVSFAFPHYADHPAPYLLGMAMAVAAARALRISVQWPNDLVHQDHKLGGVLTELLADAHARSIPVVGLGINLRDFPAARDLARRVTSLEAATGETLSPDQALQRILTAWGQLPEIQTWFDLAPFWAQLDATPGKPYHLADGRLAEALYVGPTGELVARVGDDRVAVLAADALYSTTGHE